MRFSYIDLFAGCGGLSLGLEKAGFSLVLAVELSRMAAETFYHNFIKRLENAKAWEAYLTLDIEEQSRQKLVVDSVQSVLGHQYLMSKLSGLNIDLVAGGPPCQGFSLAGRRIPEDKRNQLAWQFLDFVERVEPKAVIMENVLGISQDFIKHKKESPLKDLMKTLQEQGQGYVVQSVMLNAMHFGVPQQRPRVMLFGLRKDIASELGVILSSFSSR